MVAGLLQWPLIELSVQGQRQIQVAEYVIEAGINIHWRKCADCALAIYRHAPQIRCHANLPLIGYVLTLR